MTARTRADLESLRVRIRGRSIPGAVKLASNKVSAGPLPSGVTPIRDAATGVNRDPDNEVTALLDCLAVRLDVPRSRCVAASCVSVTQRDAPRRREEHPVMTDVGPTKVSLDTARLLRIDKDFARYVEDGWLPGWLVLVSRSGRIAHLSIYGTVRHRGLAASAAGPEHVTRGHALSARA